MRAPDPLPPALAADLEAMDAAVDGRPHDGGDPLLAELAALVAESRPVPDPAAVPRLDARVARALARPPLRRRVRAALRPRARLLAPAAGLAACALLALVIGVTGSGGGSRETTSAGGASAGAANSESAAPDRAGDKSAIVPPEPGPAPSGGNADSDGRARRKVERSATMALGAPRRELDSVADGVARTATSLGGFVASSSLSSRHGGTLDLRVPAARLGDAIERVSRLGHVRNLQRATLDITAASVSARERRHDALTERRSLLAQLAAATTPEETVRIRDRLDQVNRELEAARAAVRRVGNRARYANLGVTVVAEHHAAAAAGGWSPGDALDDAVRVLEVAAGIALIALAVALPLTLVGAPAWLAGRRLAQRRRERALDLA